MAQNTNTNKNNNEINVDVLVKALDDETNEALMNLTTYKINEMNVKILQELQFSKETVLLYMKNSNGMRLRYTNKTHLKRTKRLKYQRLLQNYKRKQNISKIENELSNYNSKSVNYKKFKKFIKKKNELNKILLEKYQNEIDKHIVKGITYQERKRRKVEKLKRLNDV